MTILYFISILIACFLLVKGADLTIKSLRKIGQTLYWSPFLLSFVFVAISTSLPEIFVGLTSGIHKISALSLGNVIGANIINITLILGLCAIISSKIKFKKTTKIQTLFSIFASFYPILLALDQKLSRLDGFFILILFLLYLLFIFTEEKKIPKEIEKILNGEKEKSIFKFFISLIFGLIILVGSAEIVVRISQILATDLKIPPILIGLILISLGTTLPELAFGLKAAIRKQEEFSLGNSLGTIVVNSCLALGLATLISPIEIISFSNFLFSALFFFFSAIIFIIFISTKNELSRTEGIFLVLLFIFFLITQLFLR
jgi:cation:H+ antiporter